MVPRGGGKRNHPYVEQTYREIGPSVDEVHESEMHFIGDQIIHIPCMASIAIKRNEPWKIRTLERWLREHMLICRPLGSLPTMPNLKERHEASPGEPATSGSDFQGE